MGSLFNKGFVRKLKEQKIVLDSQQAEIVSSTSNHIIVVAGAGSGKTRVLTERIKHLLESGVDGSNIVAITFTNMAADELKERLSDVEGVGDTFIGTIHSFANRVMSLSGQSYKIFSSDIDLKYHRYLTEKYCVHLTFDRYLDYKEMQDAFELGAVPKYELDKCLSIAEQAELRLIERSSDDVEDDLENELMSYPETVQTLCNNDNVIDFDTLLNMAYEYFESLGASVEHLLVDEFQDVGSTEFRFICGLSPQNTFFVGDDYQAIYGFKGGNVKIFLQLMQDSAYSAYYLTNNYRNSSAVLKIAETIINQVHNKIPKQIEQKSKSEGSVVIKSKKYLEDILEDFDLYFDGAKYRDFFILTRTNDDIHKVAQLCKDIGVPYTTFKREGMSLTEMRALMNKNSVKLLTVHTSKGLENTNVILYGKFPVSCPSYMCNEEERKVMYVAVTRAKENLMILN